MSEWIRPALAVGVAGAISLGLGACGAVGHEANGQWNVGVECPANTKPTIDLLNGVSPEGDMGTVGFDCRGASGVYNAPTGVELLGHGRASKPTDGRSVLVLGYSYNTGDNYDGSHQQAELAKGTHGAAITVVGIDAVTRAVILTSGGHN